jgi:hypothetical protein
VCKENTTSNPLCSNSAHYVFRIENMSCVEKNCRNRDLLNNISLPCGNECLVIDGKCGYDPHCEINDNDEGKCNETRYCRYDNDEKSETYLKCILDWCAQFNRTSCLEEGNCGYDNSVCKYLIPKKLDGGVVGGVIGGVVAGSAAVGGAAAGLNSACFF